MRIGIQWDASFSSNLATDLETSSARDFGQHLLATYTKDHEIQLDGLLATPTHFKLPLVVGGGGRPGFSAGSDVWTRW